MDLELLGRSPVGQLVPIQGQDARHGDFAYFAYLANPLPDDVPGLTSGTWTAVAKATAALAQLNQACLQLPDPRLLIRPTLWREALDTNALEGTVGGLQELLEARLPSAQYLSPEIREIRAYERVALEAFERIADRPITVGLLSELQGELCREAERPPRDPGRVRQEQVWIGPKDRPIDESRFVPAPGDDRLNAGLRQWEGWVQTEHDHLPPVLRAALAHYQFETLHPFGDGNGRIGRLVIVLQLLKGAAIRYPAITISPWFLKRRTDYQQRLFDVSVTGEWNPWVEFFCRAVFEQCAILIPAADQLVQWLAESRRRVHELRWTGAIRFLLEDLIEWPVTTVADTAARYGVTPMNATRMINHLVELEILREITGRNYNRVFGAMFVMQTVANI